MNIKRVFAAAIVGVVAATMFSCIERKEVKTSNLIDREWHLKSLSVNDIDIFIGEDTPVILFTDSVNFTGTTGCNRFMGSYTLTGKTLQLDVQAVTRMLCPNMTLENTLIEAFKHPFKVDLDKRGTELELENDKNDIEMEFRAVTASAAIIE